MKIPHFHRAGLPERAESRLLIGNRGHDRAIDEAHRIDLARAAERNGFESILTVTTRYHLDSWISAAALIAATSRIKFIVALRPGLTLPTLVAQQARSFQEISGNRLAINVVTGSHEADLRAYGDTLDKVSRYARTAEFFDVLNLAWGDKVYDYKGKYFDIEGGGQTTGISVPPPLFMGGSSPEAQAIAARFADIHLSYGEPPPMVKETIDSVRQQAADLGRSISFGILIPVIARETSAEAWRETDRLLDGLDPAHVAEQQRIIRARNSVSQARVQSLNPGVIDRAALKVYPNIWSGSGLLGGGGGSTTLVGSYAEVAERIQEYVSVGIEHFIISGSPALESIYEFGENVMPYFRPRAGVSEA